MGFKKFGFNSSSSTSTTSNSNSGGGNNPSGSWLHQVSSKKPKSSKSIKEDDDKGQGERGTIYEDKFLNSPEVMNSPTLRELVRAESKPNLIPREEEQEVGDSMETSSQCSRKSSSLRRLSSVSAAPKALLRMFSIGGGKKKNKDTSKDNPLGSPTTQSTTDLRRTMYTNHQNSSSSYTQLPNPRCNSYHQQQPSSSNSFPRVSNAPSSMNSTQYFTDSSHQHSPQASINTSISPVVVQYQRGEDMNTTSPLSEGSVRPFTTAAPASAASFTLLSPNQPPSLSPNRNLVADLNSSSAADSLSSGPSETKEETSSQLGSNNSLRMNHVPSETSYTLSVPRCLPNSHSSSTENSDIISSCSGMTEIHHEANSLTSINNSSLSSEMDTTLLRNEISRLTKELAELGEDRDRQVARMSALRTELGKSEATLKSEQIAGRQELEALLELQAQHQTLLRTQREREAAHQVLLDEKATLEKNLASALAQLEGVSNTSQEVSDLVLERNQLRGWLDEEKGRHNEIRGELAQVKAQLRTNEAQIALLESVNQEQAETIHKLELRDTNANEGALREINYYQDQLNDALRTRDELRDELDRSREQVRVLRVSMEQLLKSGVAEENSPKPPTVSTTRGTHSRVGSLADSFNFNRDSEISGNSRSVCSDDLESMSSSDFMAQASTSGSARGSARYGLGTDRRRTFGLDHSSSTTETSQTQTIQEETSPQSITMTPIHQSPEQSSKSSIFPGSSTPTDTSTYWDQRLRELLKEKDKINLEYGRIPTTKITISLRRRKEHLEQTLDQLDAEISGARSKLRALVI